ncbi:fibronectin type III domain-containing protein, partial [Virgibacillus sp. 7505]|uniref:fibronectin type III domain-containing protein n=1 Tax=Virgibacillus sp. 7505 TaxID=2022548 RepID=UPI0011406F78
MITQTTGTSFKLENLKFDTNYRILVKTVNKEGMESVGTLKSIRTEKQPPPELEPVKNVIANGVESAITVTWQPNRHPYLVGYNVYLDGTKVNAEPITRNSFKIEDLKNSQRYEVVVGAVA